MWEIKYKKIFLKELAKLPNNIQQKIVELVFYKLKDDPFNLGIIEKMKGFKNYFKIRVGNYRIGLSIDFENKIIT